MLVAETRDHPQHIVNEIERTFESMEMKINVGRSSFSDQKGPKGKF